MSSFTYEYDVKQLNNTKWLKIFYHNSTEGVFFNIYNRSEALFINTTYKYSILKYLPYINKYESTWYEFLLEYPERSETYQWRQSSSPLTVYQNPGSSSLHYEYEPIDIPEWDDVFHGLVRSNPNGYQKDCTLLTGSPNHTVWYYAIGSFQNWTLYNAFPGPASISETSGIPVAKYFIHEAILWIRVKEYYSLFIPLCTCQRNYISYRSLMHFNMVYITLLK